jgi:hypothetical protein
MLKRTVSGLECEVIGHDGLGPLGPRRQRGTELRLRFGRIAPESRGSHGPLRGRICDAYGVAQLSIQDLIDRAEW